MQNITIFDFLTGAPKALIIIFHRIKMFNIESDTNVVLYYLISSL